MSVRAFEPRFMPIGVLTAALQELTPREVRDPDPDRANRAMQAMLTMRRLDIAALERAADGEPAEPVAAEA